MRLENTKACKARLQLALLKGIHRNRLIEILELAGCAEALFGARFENISKNLSPGEMSALAQSCTHQLDAQIDAGIRSGSGVAAWTDPEYPELLKHVQYAPPVIFYKGDIGAVSLPCVAIVGSRRCSHSGRYVAERLGHDLASRGFVVVSGLARGIDSAAHKGALSAGGRTVAVLGSGADVCYPPENRKLVEDILSKGAVVSEFPFGTPPLKQNFPIRNRLLSGLSEGVIVVEARETSGALVTVGYALEQGRDVFVVPGDTTLDSTKGSNNLLKEGAKVITGAEDVFEELKSRVSERLTAVSKAESRGKECLSPAEESVLDRLTLVPAHVDELCDLLGRRPSDVLSALLSLELKGYVKQEAGNRFLRSADQ